jgi:hypothetical protein
MESFNKDMVMATARNDQTLAFLKDHADELKRAVDTMYYEEKLSQQEKRLILSAVYYLLTDLTLQRVQLE